MRLLLTALMGIIIAVPSAVSASAQAFEATPVEISAEKVNINGSVYRLHKVLKGHTLYSISKAYGVSVEDIQKANPSLSEGLKAGTLLYIPEAVPQKTAVQPETAVREDAQDREPQAPERKPVKKNSRKYRKYNVKWYETLDDVAVKFNVTTQAIIILNGIDPDSDKRIRSVMIPDAQFMEDLSKGKIPVPESAKAQDGPSAHEDRKKDAGTAEVTGDDIAGWKDKEPVSPGEPYDEGPYTITLILPFNASLSTGDLNTYTADFYAGTLVAAADLKEKGMFSNFVLNVLDLSRYGSSWELVADNALRGSELIIGPISERDMQPIAAWAKKERVPVVSPLDLKTASLAEGNPYFYLFPPQSDLALEHQLDKIAVTSPEADTTESVTVIYEQGYENSDLVLQTTAGLGERGIDYRTFKYDFLSGRGIDTLMSMSLDSMLLNKVIIPSMSEAFITDALRNLNLIKSGMGYNIDVYGMSRWKSFETVELNYFHSLDLRLAMSYYIDYNSPAAMDFIHKYRAAFNTEPTSFSFQGYDILTFFVEAMNTWGKNFPEAIINERKSLLQSDVLFLPVSDGSGYENRAFKDICFTRNWLVLDESD